MTRKTTSRIENGDFTLTQNEAAVLAGVSVQTLINWKKKPNPPPTNPDATHSAREFGKWLQERKQTAKPAQVDPGNGESRSAVETRLKLAQAIKAERENDVEAGKLIEIEGAVAAWQDILGRVRSRLLRIPYALAPLMASDSDPHSVQAKLKDAVADALSELSDDWRDDEAADGTD